VKDPSIDSEAFRVAVVELKALSTKRRIKFFFQAVPLWELDVAAKFLQDVIAETRKRNHDFISQILKGAEEVNE
jgi:hypothetical protein